MFAEDLFHSIDPPMINVLVNPLTNTEDDERLITMSVRARGCRSIHASAHVTRYAPEATIFQAVAETCRQMELLQGQVSESVLQTVLRQQIEEWVEPF